jgi:NAD(P)H-flavin reductase
MATTSYINGFFGIIKVMSKVFAYNPKKQKKRDVADKIYRKCYDKKYGVLVKKINVSPNLIELTFRFDKNPIFIPGQHVKINVAFSEWRAYSVAKVENSEITVVIDTRPSGYGSKFAQNVNIGDKAIFRMPITDLTYRKTDRDIAFIATGTGIVPFLHIIDEINKDKIKKNIKIFFGCMSESDNFIERYINPYKKTMNIENIICIEKPISKNECEKEFYTGRVTDLIKEKISDFTKYDFYICGHPNMTESAVKLLRTMGADKIYY